MLDILNFIFSSFWVWAGTVVLLAIVTQGATALFAAIVRSMRR